MSDYEDVLEGERIVPDTPAPAEVMPERSDSAADPKPVRKEKKGRRPKVHTPPADLETKGTRCPAYSPRGTRCKFCGKEH